MNTGKIIYKLCIGLLFGLSLFIANPQYAVADETNTVAYVGETTVTLNDGAVVSIEEYERATGQKISTAGSNVAALDTATATGSTTALNTASVSISSNSGPTVDLVIFSGQSNMTGHGGNAVPSPQVPKGHGYEFKSGAVTAGMYAAKDPFGSSAYGSFSDEAIYRLGTLVPSFMNAYYNSTGVPVLGLSCAKCGSTLDYWGSSIVQADYLSQVNAARAWCAANNVNIRHQYIVWLHGETDSSYGMTGEEYTSRLKQVMQPMLNNGIEQVFIITIGNNTDFPGKYVTIANAQKQLCAESPSFSLGSDLLSNLPDSYLTDSVHFNQDALNQVGTACGSTVAAYTLAR